MPGIQLKDTPIDFGQTRLAEHGLEHRPTADRRLRVRLENHGISKS